MMYDKHDTDRLLSLVEKHVKTSPEFDQRDWDAVHEMAQAWRGLSALRRFSKWIIIALGLVAAATASFSQLVHFIRDWPK